MTYIMKMREERAEAYDEGRQQGIEQGRQQGIEQGRQQGIEQGRQQGRQQGESAKLLRTVLRQLQRHADYKDIASDNEISVEQVAQIDKENQLAY